MAEIRVKFPVIYQALCKLSREHYTYLGRNGYGASAAYRKEQYRQGSVALLEAQREKLSDLEYAMLENLFIEGTRFASFSSMLTFLQSKAGEGLLHTHTSSRED